MASNLFAFSFELQTVDGDVINCSVFSETYIKACEIVLSLELPIIARDVDDLNESVKEVLQCTNEESDCKGEKIG